MTAFPSRPSCLNRSFTLRSSLDMKADDDHASARMQQIRTDCEQPVQLLRFFVHFYAQGHEGLRGWMHTTRPVRGPLHYIGQM